MTQGERVRAAALAAARGIGPAAADPLPVPGQADWDAARQTLTLPSGQTLAFVEMGDPAGAPLILVHGGTDNSRSWSLLAPEIVAGRHVFAIDLRGHGRSSAPDCCYGLLDFARDLDGFMSAKGIARADLVGHSLGSMTAAVFAALHPDKVDRLVLISTTVALTTAASDFLWSTLPGLSHPIDPDSQFMRDWYWTPTEVSADFIGRMRAECAATPRQVWMGMLEHLSLTDWTYYAPRIAAPTLILWGDQDRLFDATAQERVAAALPSARRETFAGLGHSMFWEVPGIVGPMIASFVDKAP